MSNFLRATAIQTLLAVVLLLWSAFASAAAFTSKASGSPLASGQTTWNESGVPGSGDTCTINNSHTIALPNGASWTVGDPANPTTPAIQCASNGNGVFTVGTGCSLTLLGDVIQGNANWTVSGTKASPTTITQHHATAHLVWSTSQGTTTNSKIILAGESRGTNEAFSIYFTADSATGGGIGNVTGTKFTRGGMLQATGTHFTNIGGSSTNFLDFRADSGYVGYLDYCGLSNCGKIGASANAVAGHTFRLRNTTIKSPASSDDRCCEFLYAAGTQSGVLFDGFVWDGELFIGGATSGVVSVSWTGENIGQSKGTSNPALDCTNTPHTASVAALFLHRRAATSGIPSRIMAGTINNLFLLSENEGNEGNAHAATIVPIVATTITDGVWEIGTGTSTAHDETADQLQIVGNPGSATAITISKIISPPLGGYASGALVNVSANSANLRLTVEHCTSYCSENGDSGGAFKSENCTGGAGMVQAIRDNCFVGVSAGNQWVCYTQGGTALADGSMVGCDYNNRYNFSTDGYQQADAKFSTPSPPGTHDLTANPSFVDATRNLLKWGQSINGSITTYQQVVDELMKKNDDSGYNSAFTLAAYKTYMRAGFAPTNAALATAAHDGTYMGAVDVVSATNAAFPQIILSDTRQLPLPSRKPLTLFGVAFSRN